MWWRTSVSYRSSAGRRKNAGQRLTFYCWATQANHETPRTPWLWAWACHHQQANRRSTTHIIWDRQKFGFSHVDETGRVRSFGYGHNKQAALAYFSLWLNGVNKMCNLINLTIESCIGSNERHYEVELTINVSNRTHQSINTPVSYTHLTLPTKRIV